MGEVGVKGNLDGSEFYDRLQGRSVGWSTVMDLGIEGRGKGSEAGFSCFNPDRC